MTNPNMGTAHGRIKVTYDDRGSAKATAALERMEKQFALMNKRLESIEKALNDTNSGLEDVEKQTEKTARATKKHSKDMFDSLKAFRAFRSDVRMTVDELQFMYRTMQRGEKYFHTFANSVRFLNTVGQYSRGNNASVIKAMTIEMARLSTTTEGVAKNMANFQMEVTKRFTANRNVLLGTRSTITLLTAGFVNLRNKVLGVSSAMGAAPSWIQNMMRLSRAIALTSGAMFLMSKLLGPFRLVERIGRSGVIAAIGKSANYSANQFERLGKVVEKVFGRDYTTKFVTRLRKTEGAVSSFFSKATVSSVNFSNTLNVVSNGLLDFANNSKSLIGGIALLTRSLTNLWGRLQWFFKLPKWPMAFLAITFSKLLPSALHVFQKALTGTSNLLMGLLDGVIQLGKGLTILPGIFASIGAVVASLFPVFAGLGDRFKDLFDTDPIKRLEAFNKLPEHLRPLGKALQELQPRWEKFQASLQTTAFRDAEKQISKIAGTYFPLWESGAKQVVTVMRQLKDEFVGFLNETQTQKDFSTIFTDTAVAIQNISTAVGPALAGLRDMAVVGTGMISELSASAGILLQRFGEWARVNRENGQLMSWMRDARKGIEDLATGLIDLTQGLWRVLTVFRTNSGSNFLASFAEDMERFDNAIRKSEAIGFLSRLRNNIRNLGENKIDEVVSLFRTLGDAIERTKPFIMALSDAFSGVFLRAVESSVTIISQFLNVLNALGLSNAIGWILGFAGAATMLPKIFSTTITAIQAVSGAIMILANKGKVIAGIETAFLKLGTKMEALGPLGGKIGEGLINVTSASSKAITVIGALAGTFAAVGTALALVLLVIDAGNDELNTFRETMDKSGKASNDFKEQLKKAFIDDGGMAGRTVLDTLDQRVNEYMQSLKDLEEQAPSISAHVGDFFEDLFKKPDITNWKDLIGGNIGDLFSDDDDINKFQEIGEKAKWGRRGLEDMIKAGVDLNAVLRMDAGTFNTFIEQLRGSGSQSMAAAADELITLKAEVDEVQKSVQELGPAGILAAQGVDRLAEAGGSATTKLEGLKMVLQALGFLQVDAMEAAANYADAIENFGEKVQQAITEGDGLANVFKDGILNVDDSETARQLLPVFKSLSDSFIAMASSGGNVDDMMRRLDEQLGTVAPKLNMTKEELRAFLQNNMGLQTDIIKIGIQLEGKDPVTQQMGDLMMRLQAMAITNKPMVPIEFDTHSAAAQFDQFIEQQLGKDYFDSAGSNLTIKPGIEIPAADMAKLEQYLSSKGIQLNPSAPAPPQPATIPTAPALGPAPAGGSQGGLPGILDPTKIQEQTEGSKKFLDEFFGQITGTADSIFDEAKESGSTFVDMYAAGLSENPAAIREAERMAEEIKKRFHSSPPKKGPLASHGDAARYAGMMFAKTYAGGITSETSVVAGAASGMAGAAGGALRGDKLYEAGQFLGQLSDLVDFAQHMVEAMDKMGQAILGFGKFLSDPEGKGTFFGRQRRFRRDPTISDEQLAQQRADAEQQRIFDFFGSRQYPTGDQIDWTTGMPKIQGPGKLARNASKSDIIAAIVAEGQRRGANEAQIQGAIAGALVESGAQNLTIAVNQDSLGVYQQRPSQGWGTPEQLTDPNYAISKFYDAYLPNAEGVTDALAAAEAVADTQKPREDLRGKYAEILPEAIKEFQNVLSSGAVLPTIQGQIAGIPGITQLERPPNVTGGQNQPAADAAAALINQIFPAIQQSTIGGQRQDSLPYHTEGRALDVMIPNYDTPEGKALGDAIKNWALQNAEALGLEDTIWQDIWQPPGGPGSKMGNVGITAGHFDHVHLTFKDGAKVDIGPGGTNIKMPVGSSAVLPEGMGFGPPPRPDYEAPTSPNLVVRNPDGTFSPVHGAQAGQAPGDVQVNPTTGKPWTPEEIAEYWNRPENQPQFDQALLEGAQLGKPGQFQGTQEELLDETKAQTPLLRDALAAAEEPSKISEDQAIAYADALQDEIARQESIGTPESRARAGQLKSAQGVITSEFGLSQEENQFDTAMSIFGNMASIAGDIFQIVNTVIDTIGATKHITETLARGPANTEDIFNMIDDVQKFIQLGADIAGAVASVSSAVGSIVSAAGGADPSGGASGAAAAIAAVSQIAGLVQSAFETVNAVIDLGQEAYRIIGSYFGDFLGILVGGAAGALEGQVRFLLDQETNQLLAYSADNPLDKRAHGTAFDQPNPSARNQLIGNINMYAGPGTDPRDMTRQMMYQVKASTMSQAVGQ